MENLLAVIQHQIRGLVLSVLPFQVGPFIYQKFHGAVDV